MLYTINYLNVINQNRYNNGEFIITPEMITAENTIWADKIIRLYEEIDFTDILDLVKTLRIGREKFIGYSSSFDSLVIEEYAENYLIEAESTYITEICRKLEELEYKYQIVGENNFIHVPKRKRTNFQERQVRHKWAYELY